MIKSLLNPIIIDLQLFSDGGGEGTGGFGADAASHTDGTSPDVGAKAQKSYSEEEVQNLIKARVKSYEDKLHTAEESAKKYSEAAPLLEALASRHNTDAADIAALTRAVEADDSYLEDEAMERGLTVEQLRSFKKSEREAKAFKAEADALRSKIAADEQARKWMGEIEQTRQKYGTFDFDTEMQNPEFKAYLKAGIPIQKAYEVIHMDTLIPMAMRSAADAAKKDVAADIMARGRRPGENGLNSQGAVDVKTEVGNLSSSQIKDIMNRAERGQKIKFK